MSDLTPEEALAAAMIDDGGDPPLWEVTGPSIRQQAVKRAALLSERLSRQGYAIVRSDDLAGLRAFVEYVAAQNPTSSRNTDGRPGWGYPVVNDIVNRARAALEGVSR